MAEANTEVQRLSSRNADGSKIFSVPSCSRDCHRILCTRRNCGRVEQSRAGRLHWLVLSAVFHSERTTFARKRPVSVLAPVRPRWRILPCKRRRKRPTPMSPRTPAGRRLQPKRSTLSTWRTPPNRQNYTIALGLAISDRALASLRVLPLRPPRPTPAIDGSPPRRSPPRAESRRCARRCRALAAVLLSGCRRPRSGC
jgi:hypothetical protein